MNKPLSFTVSIIGYLLVGYAAQGNWGLWLLAMAGAILIDLSHAIKQ